MPHVDLYSSVVYPNEDTGSLDSIRRSQFRVERLLTLVPLTTTAQRQDKLVVAVSMMGYCY